MNKLEKATKIVLTAAVVGTGCKIALDRHHSHMAFRKKVGEIMSAIGPHRLDSEAGQMMKFCMDLLKRL